jgi:ubiquinone/menaquinone biosynthesis C-methylase UbiE
MIENPYPHEELLRIWREAIDPEGIGMPESIARDIASFTGESTDLVLKKMDTGKEAFKELWEASHIDASDPKAVESFYRRQFVEAYELANWHCGREKGIPPLTYPWAAMFARRRGLKRVLDFGSGIGTGALCLLRMGCEVHLADIAQDLLQFADHRLRSRGFAPRVINLCSGSEPPHRYYDLITCFDVLEHVPDQTAKLRELGCYLRNGGFLLVNFMFSSHDPDRPMHVSSAPHWDRMARKTQMVPDWSETSDTVKVLRRTPTARFVNQLARWSEWFQKVE